MQITAQVFSRRGQRQPKPCLPLTSLGVSNSRSIARLIPEPTQFQFQEFRLRAAGRRRRLALLSVEHLAAFVQSLDDRLAFIFVVVVPRQAV